MQFASRSQTMPQWLNQVEWINISYFSFELGCIFYHKCESILSLMGQPIMDVEFFFYIKKTNINSIIYDKNYIYVSKLWTS